MKNKSFFSWLALVKSCASYMASFFSSPYLQTGLKRLKNVCCKVRKRKIKARVRETLEKRPVFSITTFLNPVLE